MGTNTTDIPEPGEFLASSETLNRIEAVCRRAFHDSNLIDECYVYILDGLSENDFHRMRKYNGRDGCKFSSFVFTVVNNLIIEFRRSKYGRRRIPLAVRQLGQWAETVYRLICWQRYTFDEAYYIMVLDHGLQCDQASFEKDVEPIAQARCADNNPGFVSTTTDDGGQRELKDENTDDPFEELLRKLDIETARMIREYIDRQDEQDKTLLYLTLGEGVSAAAAGRVAGFSASKARRRKKRHVLKIREFLLADGRR